MAGFRQYVLSLTAAALLGGILLSCVPEGSTGKVLRLVCGILITVTALKPLGQCHENQTGEYHCRRPPVFFEESPQGLFSFLVIHF